jgi:hypothetical protein
MAALRRTAVNRRRHWKTQTVSSWGMLKAEPDTDSCVLSCQLTRQPTTPSVSSLCRRSRAPNSSRLLRNLYVPCDGLPSHPTTHLPPQSSPPLAVKDVPRGFFDSGIQSQPSKSSLLPWSRMPRWPDRSRQKHATHEAIPSYPNNTQRLRTRASPTHPAAVPRRCSVSSISLTKAICLQEAPLPHRLFPHQSTTPSHYRHHGSHLLKTLRPTMGKEGDAHLDGWLGRCRKDHDPV